MEKEFKGFSEKYHEWRPFIENNLPVIRVERMSQPTHVSLEERIQCFHEHLKREIKRKLFSGRKDDPEVRIEIAVDEDVFNEGIGSVAATSVTYQRNKAIYQVQNHEVLDRYVELKWYERIINENGDFAYVTSRTVRTRLMNRSPIVEYKFIGNKYVRSELEDGYQVVFNFVHGDGNRQGLTIAQINIKL